MGQISRRDFLKKAGLMVAGGIGTGAALISCGTAYAPNGSDFTRDLFPSLDNIYSLGNPGLRWASLHVLNAEVTNLVLAGTITQVLTVYLDTATVGSTTSIAVCNKITAFTLTLPAATGSARTIQIKNIGAGVVAVEGNLAETIDDELNQHINQYEGISIVDYAAGKWAIY
jgi:hypothetical protein